MPSSFYELDRHDRIISTGGAWDSDAIQNGSPELQSEQVAGASIWDSIQGFDVKSYLNSMFFAVRLYQKRLELAYRSRQNGRIYNCKLVIEPLPENALRVHHVPQPSVHKSEVEVADSRFAETADAQCGVCCSVLFGADWVDVQVLDEPSSQTSEYRVCSSCKSNARDAIEAVSHPLADNIDLVPANAGWGRVG